MILQRAEHSSAIKYMESHSDSNSFLKIVCFYLMLYSRPALIGRTQVCGLFEGIYYLHTRLPPIIHGDVHDVSIDVLIPSLILDVHSKCNVVVSRTGDCLLCDFGLSRIRHEISRTHTTILQGGRARFIAPEIWFGEEDRINESSDIYSLAMTIYALGTRSVPLAHIRGDAAACRVAREGERPQKPVSLGGLTINEIELIWPLMEKMWSSIPHLRPTVSSARDEMRRTCVIPSELTTVPVAVSPTSVPVLTSTTHLYGVGGVPQDVSSFGDAGPPVERTTLMLGYASCYKTGLKC